VQDKDDVRLLTDVFDFAGRIEYRHKGLSSEAYAAHPLRVASMCLQVGDTPDAKAGCIGLLHNVFEVTDTGFDEIDNLFGVDIARAIATLTVDRTRQWDEPYKERYYQQIRNEGKSVCLVKVIDKLDNLFLIGCNQNPDIRRRYMDEISRWVVPMATAVDLATGNYMRVLLSHCENAHNLPDEIQQ